MDVGHPFAASSRHNVRPSFGCMCSAERVASPPVRRGIRVVCRGLSEPLRLRTSNGALNLVKACSLRYDRNPQKTRGPRAKLEPRMLLSANKGDTKQLVACVSHRLPKRANFGEKKCKWNLAGCSRVGAAISLRQCATAAIGAKGTVGMHADRQLGTIVSIGRTAGIRTPLREERRQTNAKKLFGCGPNYLSKVERITR